MGAVDVIVVGGGHAGIETDTGMLLSAHAVPLSIVRTAPYVKQIE